MLVKEGYDDLVRRGRDLETEEANPVRMLGQPKFSAVYSPFSIRQILEFIIFLPLNFIPVAGTPIFLFLTGYRAGPLHHWRYFKLLDYSKTERNRFAKARKLRYTWFGTSALLLQLVPVLSMLFLLTTVVGSALWAVSLEKARRLEESAEGEEGADSAVHRETVNGAPPYHDHF